MLTHFFGVCAWRRGRNELWPLLLLSLLAFFLLFPLSASAHAFADNGRITGQLLDGTKNNAPLVGQQVKLQEAQGANSRDVSTVTTDAHGNYNFANLATDKTISYAVYKSYQGAQYVSDVVALDTNPTQQLNLTVYEATTSTAKVAVLQNTILMHQPDAQKGIMTVSEIFSFRNLDSHTYVGSFDTSKGKPNALRFSLPGNARNITLGTGFDGYHTIQVDLGFATDAALPPGITQFSFSYQIPYSAASYDFRYVTVYPTLQFSLLIPPTIQVDPGFMTVAGVTNAGDHQYRLFKSEDLLNNDEVHVSLEGLPLSNTSTANLLNTNTIWLIGGGILLLAIVVIAGYLYSLNRRKKIVATQKRGKGTSTNSATTAAKNAKVQKETPLVVPKDKKDVLLQELLALDKSFEVGKLSKAVYNERRAKTKARLRAVLNEQEASRR
ncbi:MAG: hypothetical protein NVS4B12_09840 [Ktedonobacteraceae bacterium]